MKQAREDEKRMIKNKILTAGFLTTIMLIASFTALAVPNSSLTEHKLGTQPISENSDLVNVTLYGYVKVWTWVKGPFGILIPKKVPLPNVEVWVFQGVNPSLGNWHVILVTNDQGYYECSVAPSHFYSVGAKRGDSSNDWKWKRFLVLSKDMYAPITFSDL
jgi:hypothetical protein